MDFARFMRRENFRPYLLCVLRFLWHITRPIGYFWRHRFDSVTTIQLKWTYYGYCLRVSHLSTYLWAIYYQNIIYMFQRIGLLFSLSIRTEYCIRLKRFRQNRLNGSLYLSLDYSLSLRVYLYVYIWCVYYKRPIPWMYIYIYRRNIRCESCLFGFLLLSFFQSLINFILH